MSLPARRDRTPLIRLAEDVPTDEAVVELGVFQGGSLIYMASGHPDVYGIDPWGLDGPHLSNELTTRWYGGKQGLQNMLATERLLAKHGLSATLIRGFSTEVAETWDKPVGLLHIDAHHTYIDVMADFAAWQPHLASGATVVFDDYFDRFPGVMQAVDELCDTVLTRGERFGIKQATHLRD